ncbi:bifunctional UDP-N-acetylmuramoyl-tripeptide:D-alanyl-D-alanine ligase/alanine racemase [Sphingobacterium faecale]|uniref:Alanine racemase n=1 Tax=Sphingobacterium faecale TaxID=2803775 RepID=A0ABS1R253_9SPHI|nr:bifunctional UDP-N-acetylmuramoyl-tripeptide:D-alanyl-D-alanine ligase/alanine racemase [Sphingobacterium faecale]MBL1408629.1 bifunctional UDP-N-acetylmuramoyl-tripeptide:D-alanyl-D-alanine ligase/alanine racemase [Sphingobacterium faecale]
MYTLDTILQPIGSRKSHLNLPNSTFSALAYDTRKIRMGESSLFFALVQQRDGHRYIEEAYEKGVRNFVISDNDFDISPYLDANFVWVENTLRALQQLAAYHRNHFSIPVIGITGSNGKTIVKTWLHQLLAPEYNCYQSPKSYNSQLGVALSLWNLTKEHDLALIEAGISKVGEMDALQDIIRPTLGILTGIGPAHQEGFDSEKQKIDEKLKLFKEVKTVVAPSAALSSASLVDSDYITWGDQLTDNLRLLKVQKDEETTILMLRYGALECAVTVPFIDKASIDNVLTCTLVMLTLGYDMEVIKKRLAWLRPLEMRLQLKKGKHNSSIIDDTYSNDLASLQIALDFLGQQNQSSVKKLVLSDFEGQEWTSLSIGRLAELLNVQSLSQIILVGNRLTSLQQQLTTPSLLFESTDLLIDSLEQLDLRDNVLLLKGGRRFELERLSRLLVEKSHDTVLEINLKALENNLSQYRSCLKKGVRMMTMVKAFSYGSGSFEIANVLQFNKVDYLTVAFVDEGAELRRGGISLPIMVLSPHEGTFEDILLYSLEPEIYSLRILKAFVAFLKERDIKAYPIHLKLDTGMHRLGFMEREIEEALMIIAAHTQLRVATVFSHLVGAGNEELKKFSAQQIALFKRMSTQVETTLGYTVIKHICNTSGIVHHPEAHFDMVRLGIGAYGFDMAPNSLSLQEVGSLKTTITQIKELSAGETVGYDRKGVLQRDSRIATVKIGYADGYDRRLGNGVGKMAINNSLVPTVGNICMDMCMLDVTDIVAREGDEVLVFPNINQSAKNIGTIPYELLTGISSRVKRVYFYE